MSIKEMRKRTGLSQSKFANLFKIPVSTLKDWESERRTPPAYVADMIKTILEFKGYLVDNAYLLECDKRRKSVDKVMAILLSATKGPDEKFMNVLESYIMGEISLEEIERKVDNLEYLGV